MSIEALDALVYTVLAAIWGGFGTLVIVGLIALHRHNAGMHRSLAEAVDSGHQPAHAAPARPSRLAAALDGWRELAHAHHLLTGGSI